MSDHETIATAMLRLHGHGAADLAKDYAARYLAQGDDAEHRKWLEILRAIQARAMPAAGEADGS
jgi:aminoglycoside phosphotransferase family enzyme